MNTLNIDNIQWIIVSAFGKPAFVYADSHSIMYDPNKRCFKLYEGLNTIVQRQTASECLKIATKVIYNYAARAFVPMWEN